MYEQQHDVNKIFGGFYIGSMSAVNRETLDTFDITHVISVVNGYDPKWKKLYKFLVLDVMDMEEENISQYFEQTFKFIEEGREQGAVLVHCQAGVSRSASICIAYCIKKLKLSYEDAHGIVQDARSIIYPNDGFIEQLRNYSDQIRGIGNIGKVELKPGKLELKSIDSSESDNSDDSFESDDSEIERLEEEMIKSIDENKFRYTCRKCSKELFLGSDLVQHNQGEGQSAFHWNKRDHKPKNNDNNLQYEEENDKEVIQCTSFFLNEIEFALNQTTGGGNDGKIFCDNQNCKEKIGSWCWSGDTCSCGTWVAPFFQIPKTRVDEKPIKNSLVFIKPTNKK